MSAPAYEGWRLDARCQCRLGALPLRVTEDAIAFFRSLEERGIIVPPDLTVQTYYCSRCKTTVVITARALRFTPGSQPI